MLKITEIEKIIDEGLSSLRWDMEPVELYRPIEYLISIGGKRLRPRLALLCYNLFKEEIDNTIMYPAMGLEVFHGFTLIHDDIMDGADKRRNQPTVHKRWGNNVAILSGDVMCIKSYQLIANAPKEYATEVLSLFSNTAAQVCEGQQYDMNFERMLSITTEDYMKMIGLKTAVLIACSAKLGAVIGGAGNRVSEGLYDYAYKLGLAFQIKDDLLDSFGSSHVFGKNIGGDIVSNKKTWLLVEALKMAEGKEKELLNHLLTNRDIVSDEKVAAMKELYVKLGVRDAADVVIESLHNSACDTLMGLDLKDSQLGQLREFAVTLLNRES